MWQPLGLDAVLARAGLSDRTRGLTERLTLTRLVGPLSEPARPDGVRRTAPADLRGETVDPRADASVDQTLDRLHPHRGEIERALAERERTLFTLADRLVLSDLPSPSVEGRWLQPPQAQRGDSRDRRPDCQQGGLGRDREGCPPAHDVWAGERPDRTTVAARRDALEGRVGRPRGAPVVVDRGRAFAGTLQPITDRPSHALGASRPGERHAPRADCEAAGGQEIVREPAPANPGQPKPRGGVQRQGGGAAGHLLCTRAGRAAKDRAIRAKPAPRLRGDLRKRTARGAPGTRQDAATGPEASGRLPGRAPRGARSSASGSEAAPASGTGAEDAEQPAGPCSRPTGRP